MKWMIVDTQCVECNGAFRYYRERTNTHQPDLLVCPWCGKALEVSTKYQYLQITKIYFNPLDKSQESAIIESGKRKR